MTTAKNSKKNDPNAKKKVTSSCSVSGKTTTAGKSESVCSVDFAHCRGGPVVIRPASKMVIVRKRKADEVVNLSADVEEWIKTELWEEKTREVAKVVVKEEEEMEEGLITKMLPEILNVIFSWLPRK